MVGNSPNNPNFKKVWNGFGLLQIVYTFISVAGDTEKK